MGSALEQRIGPFTLGRLIGEGTVGRVFEASKSAGAKVAAKWVRPEVALSGGVGERLRVHAISPPRLEHPLIHPLDAIFCERDDYLLISPISYGSPLVEYDAPIATLAAEFCKLLEAFDYAHRRGFVHADIKPGNFVVHPSGSFRILDFQLSRILGISEITAELFGAAEFISPEQHHGSGVDARSDIYSLGLLFRTVLARQGAVPPALTKVIDRSVMMSSDQRYRTAAEFRQALLSCTESAAIYAAPAILTPPPRPAPEPVAKQLQPAAPEPVAKQPPPAPVLELASSRPAAAAPTPAKPAPRQDTVKQSDSKPAVAPMFSVPPRRRPRWLVGIAAAVLLTGIGIFALVRYDAGPAETAAAPAISQKSGSSAATPATPPQQTPPPVAIPVSGDQSAAQTKSPAEVDQPQDSGKPTKPEENRQPPKIFVPPPANLLASASRPQQDAPVLAVPAEIVVNPPSQSGIIPQRIPAPAPPPQQQAAPAAPANPAAGPPPDVREARLIRGDPPKYPPLAEQFRVAGKVHLEVTVSASGRVEAVRRIDGHPLLSDAAAAAVKGWLYEPARVNSRAVPVKTTVEIVFNPPRK